MEVVISKGFHKQLLKLKSKDLNIKVVEFIKKLQSSDSIEGLVNIKKMQGANNAYRLRIGDYRLGFWIKENTIQIQAIALRKDIYNVFP